jgi:hypothetical protein
VDVVVGEPLHGRDDHRAFIRDLTEAIRTLGEKTYRPDWT